MLLSISAFKFMLFSLPGLESLGVVLLFLTPLGVVLLMKK
jgi:hypothetical protein